MFNLYETVSDLCAKNGISGGKMCADLGISRSLLTDLKKGRKKTIQAETALKIADYFNIPIETLLGVEVSAYPPNVLPMPEVKKVPRIGKIACGEPILAVEENGEYDLVPDYVQCDFTLVCKGDSMINARINDGDIVCIRQQDMVDSGDIAAVLIDDEATLKRVRFAPGKVTLWPENPAYEPMIYAGEEINAVHILGKATHFISAVR